MGSRVSLSSGKSLHWRSQHVQSVHTQGKYPTDSCLPGPSQPHRTITTPMAFMNLAVLCLQAAWAGHRGGEAAAGSTEASQGQRRSVSPARPRPAGDLLACSRSPFTLAAATPAWTSSFSRRSSRPSSWGGEGIKLRGALGCERPQELPARAPSIPRLPCVEPLPPSYPARTDITTQTTRTARPGNASSREDKTAEQMPRFGNRGAVGLPLGTPTPARLGR